MASRGGTKTALRLHLPALSASSSPPPDSTGTRSTEKGEAMPAISTSFLACGLRRAASLRIRLPHLQRSGRLPSRRSAGDLAAAAAEAGRMRGGQGRFNLCPSEAASLAALAASGPPRRARVGSGQRGGSSMSGSGRKLSAGRRLSHMGRRHVPLRNGGRRGPVPAEGLSGLGLGAGRPRRSEGGAIFPYGKTGRGGGGAEAVEESERIGCLRAKPSPPWFSNLNITSWFIATLFVPLPSFWLLKKKSHAHHLDGQVLF